MKNNSRKTGRKIFADPHLGINVADAGKRHLVFITVRPVQAMQPLDGFVGFVINQAAYGQQGRADRYVQVSATLASASRADIV